MSAIELEVMGGEDIYRVCEEAVALANRVQHDVHFRFNGVFMFVSPNSTTVEELINRYNNRPDLRNIK